MVWRPKHQLVRSLSVIPAIASSFWLSTEAITQFSTQVGIGEQLVPAKPMTVLSQQLPVSVPNPSALPPQIVRQGLQISLNGRIWPTPWSQRQLGTNPRILRTGVSDVGLMRTIGVELLNTWNVTRQPVQWFSQPEIEPMPLATWLTNQYRYLDLTDFAQIMGWQLQVDGTTLRINSPPTRVQDIRTEQLPLGDRFPTSFGLRIIVDLDRPTPWQISQAGTVFNCTIDATTDPALLERLNPLPNPTATEAQRQPGIPSTTAEEEVVTEPSPPPPQPTIAPPFQLQSAPNQTTIRVNIPNGLRPRVWSIPAPNRLVIDFVPETLVERNILWANGINWRQQYVEMRDTSKQSIARFPVVWLEINPRQPGLSLKPIWSNPTNLVGIAPLSQTAQQWQVAAAINAGFFNRNTQLPLGAIRRDGRWLSSPILNRGAIAWNDLGEVKIGHLSLQNTLITATGERLPVVSVNSGYVERGITRHTPEWGIIYTPLSDNETIITIQNNQVISQSPASLASQTTFPIPSNGYLLAIRDNPIAVNALAVGTTVRYESIPIQTEFSRYPQILGAGPVLLQNRQIVLDAKAEKFRDSFIRESAVRSAIGNTNTGTLLFVTVGNRTGGPGPTLREMALLMQQMGAMNALNLDGGSSTSLYLGGQLLNRPPGTAARVHNGLGIFLQ
jgi:Phosphodiester glycosidase